MPGTFLLVGKPGSGKTTTACSLEHPTLLIDVDCKAHRMDNIRPLVESGDVTIIPVKIPLVEDKLSYRALNPEKGPKKMPRGFLWTVDLLNEILEGGEEYVRYNTIVLDSITRLCEHLKRLLIYIRAQGKFGKDNAGQNSKDMSGDMNWPSWGSHLSNLEETFTQLCQTEKNLVCTVHELEKTEKDAITKTTISLGFWPMIDGQMREKISGYFDECYYMDKTFKKVDGTTKYSMRTQGNKYGASRSSLKDIPEFVESDLTKIVSKYWLTEPTTTKKERKK